MKKLIKMVIMLAAVSALYVQAFAATPLYKPVKLPEIPTITLPRMDFSAAVDAYLKDHPISRYREQKCFRYFFVKRY